MLLTHHQGPLFSCPRSWGAHLGQSPPTLWQCPPSLYPLGSNFPPRHLSTAGCWISSELSTSLVACYCNRECWMDSPALLSGPGLPDGPGYHQGMGLKQDFSIVELSGTAVSGTGHLLLPGSTLLPPATKTLAINAQCTSSRSSYLCWDFTL